MAVTSLNYIWVNLRINRIQLMDEQGMVFLLDKEGSFDQARWYYLANRSPTINVVYRLIWPWRIILMRCRIWVATLESFWNVVLGLFNWVLGIATLIGKSYHTNIINGSVSISQLNVIWQRNSSLFNDRSVRILRSHIRGHC